MTKDSADEPGAQDLVAIMPHFNVKDWDAAKPIMEEFVTKTRTEAGFTYYGWTKCENSLVCREAYKNGEAVLAHLDNVGACIGKLLDGPAELAEISIHGPQAELDKVKEATEKLGTKYFAYHSGFARIKYVLPSSKSPPAGEPPPAAGPPVGTTAPLPTEDELI